MSDFEKVEAAEVADESMTPEVNGTGDLNLVVIVNGRKKTVESSGLTFEEVVELAFDNPQRGPNVIFTVTYRNAAGTRQQGSLLEGRSVEIKDGTVFNVTRTDKS